MAMGEGVLIHLNTSKCPKIRSDARLLFPDNDVLLKAIDKSETLILADRLGIDCPRTELISSGAEIERIVGSYELPVVLKFRSWSGPSRPAELRFSAKIVYDKGTFRELLEKSAGFGVFPLVQEYVAGKGIGIELCMSGGQPVAIFQHERIHELPLSGGASVYRKSAPLDSELVAQSVALLQSMAWDGFAMVEYRRDPTRNRTVLMEVNGRFWGSLALALRAGVNFPLALYRTMGEGESLSPDAYRQNVRVKQLSGHLRWFWHAFVVRRDLPPEGYMSRMAVLGQFLASWWPAIGFDIEAWDDPKPGLLFWWSKVSGE